ncbi:MAG: Flagellar basal-body rod protein FlgC [Smithella sp. PtaU1.Bin162]|jgi:flagellar basal-body rod protein FlgC|nr:MAG: Flagellar basal-body rod protein FlgC [Smithella sp. PtaU1.Bin162]
MELFATFKICSTGLSAQRAKMDIITSNLANANTTNTPEGGPYKRKRITFTEDPLKKGFDKTLGDAVRGVKIKQVTEDQEGIKRVYDPAHPDADKEGFVSFPNVNVMMEMSDMIVANRSYEACATAFDAAKNMAQTAMNIGK